MPFKKGQSGNPGGRVGVPAEGREMARRHSEEAIERLIHWMKSDDGRISVAAANALLDRGFGRPAQLIDLSVDVVSRRIREAWRPAVEHGTLGSGPTVGLRSIVHRLS